MAFHSITERLNTKSALRKFFFTLMMSLAQIERYQISERTIVALIPYEEDRPESAEKPLMIKKPKAVSWGEAKP